jgi:uncharacterized membrane protein HdeD (DUF308 family)
MVESKGEAGLASRWKWLVVRGAVAVVFGFLAFTRPGAMGMSLVLLFGVYAFLAGVASIAAAARTGRVGEPGWGTLLVEGLLDVAVAVVAVLWPAATALAFVWVIGFWAIVTGGMAIATGVRLRRLIRGEWALMLAGALSVAFGALALYRPLAGGVAFVWWLGTYALAAGLLMIVVGLRLRTIAPPTRAHPHLMPQPG